MHKRCRLRSAGRSARPQHLNHRSRLKLVRLPQVPRVVRPGIRPPMIYEFAVLLAGFLLLTVLVVRGASIFVAAPLCAIAILAFSGADPAAGMSGPFMA